MMPLDWSEYAKLERGAALPVDESLLVMLRERRKELNLTQKQLAEKLDSEQSYIARVENGKADIQLSSFFRIAAVLGIQFIPTYVN